ncbi:microtubule-associated protein futsch-like [Strongylocentrotus purpuratus]|uniref:Uncharacterized protein n=1 Tax=Strongylocentrotus purpuratus TaxID=7668 RepID=A0A7M7NJS1_STRPU|nr:microtubule-associated protein futsch-like [Strongylocentrotus purpuratus]
MDTSSGGVGASEPRHHEPVPEPAMMDVVLSAEGVQTEVELPGCHNCTVLQKELEDCKRDRAFFVDIKRKMILTDTLIQKHQSKCQAFEEQQKSIQNLTARLAQSKRDCKVLEEQLATTLKDIIPWKKDKERFLQESQESKKQFEVLHNKLSAQESLIRQYESKLEVCDEEKATLESDILMLKSQTDAMKQSSKKASTSLEKAKEDTSKLRKEMSQVRKSKAAVNMKFERAKTKMKELCNLLTRHGVRAPRMKGFGSSDKEEEEEEEYMEETDSSDQDEDGGGRVTMVTKERTPRDAVKPVTVPTYRPQQSGVQSQPSSAPPSRRPFPKMDFTSVACLSPLPPSPPNTRVDKSNSSDSNESDTTLAEAAAKIEAQLSTPVLLRRRTEQPDKEQSRPSTRVSSRRKAPGRVETKSTGATEDPESNADGAGSRRGLRFLRKSSESSEGTRKPSTGTCSRESKKLEQENSADGMSEKKRPRGRPRKVKDVCKEKHADVDSDDREDLAQRLQGRVQTLSSSDEEVERKEDAGGKCRRERNGVSAVRTRSKTKGQVASGQSGQSVSEDCNVLPLTLSSDESKRSLYNPGGSAASDGSETASIVGRKKRLTMKRQTLRKSSALSDSSESEDDRRKVNGTHPSQDVVEPSASTCHQSRKPEASLIEGVAVKRLSDESNKSNKLTSDSEADSLTNARRTSRRLAHRQRNVKTQASSENTGNKTEHSKDMTEIQSKVATNDRERVSDNDKQSLENPQRLLAKKRVTRHLNRKLLRSMSSPPRTSCSRRGSEDDKSGGDRPSQYQRKPGRSVSKDENSILCKSSKEDGMPSKLGQESVGEDTSSQGRTLLRNLSSPARLTRSASRNFDSSESCLPFTGKTSSEQEDQSSVKVDRYSPSEDEKSSRLTRAAANPTRRLSQKRTHSDSQSSEDEKGVKISKSMDTGAVESGNGDKVGEDNEELPVRNEGKVLMRSETEEFVACMDDVPCMDGEEQIETGKQTGESLTAEKDKTIPSDVKDTKKRKLPSRQSKRIKLSSVDTIEKKGEGSSCMEGVFDDAGDENSTIDANRKLKNHEHVDRPSTSRGLESSVEGAHVEALRAQPPILVPQHRERHASIASLPSSGRNSPVSPLQEPFQGFDARPISPMSPERPVERVSPIMPTFFFDLPAFPRMLSPLPPSPPRFHPAEDTVDVTEGDMQEVMSEENPEAQAQPRMISPLFPTPVPFAVSPIPEMSVPPAISPIADVQHPPEISPIADVQPPVLGVQTIQTVSPGKSPQLPSPRIFHSVAPSDAITVRPQHSSPSYNQDKTTAIRSLNAVLDRDDNKGDHRSSFSKKLIARRSSAEEPGKKPGDTSQNNPPSHSEARNETRAINSGNLVLNYTQRICAKPEPANQPHNSTRERKANESLVKESQSVTLPQRSTNNLGELHGKNDVVHPPLLQNKSGFSEYLRRTDGHEDATAFSRVIPHREENRSSGSGTSSMQPPKTEETKIPHDECAEEKTRLVPDRRIQGEPNEGRNVPNATEPVVPDKAISKLPSKTTVGNIWGQMAFHDRGERANRSRKKKQTRGTSVNSQVS